MTHVGDGISDEDCISPLGIHLFESDTFQIGSTDVGAYGYFSLLLHKLNGYPLVIPFISYSQPQIRYQNLQIVYL